jgi:hypothetical protein
MNQLNSQAAQINASKALGQVAVHPLHTKAIIGFGSCMAALIFPIGACWQSSK